MIGLNKACTKTSARSKPVDDRGSKCICTATIFRMPPLVTKPYGAAISLSSPSRCPSTYGTHRILFDDSPQPLSLKCHPSKLMPSTWSAVNRCLFLLRTSTALEKARSDVALDACAHNQRLAPFAISGYLTWYLPRHCNTVVSLKSLAPPIVSTGL